MIRELIVLEESSTGIDKRLYELLCMKNRIDVAYRDTWCSLFETAGYIKSLNVMNSIGTRVTSLLDKKIAGFVYYEVQLIGSTGKIDIAAMRRQKFLITVHRSG